MKKSNRPTKRALDAEDFAAFLGIFTTLAGFRFRAWSASCLLASTERRWALFKL
jgi:hypothetical protein